MKRSYLALAGILILVLILGAVFLLQEDDEKETTDNDKVWKVGILSGSPIFDSAITTLQEELAKAGYVEGENIEYTLQSANGNEAEMARISQEYVDADMDMIISTTNAGAIAAHEATKGTDIPVIFMFVIAPVEIGIVENLGQIENVTGVRNPLEDFVGRRLELLLALDPTATRLWAPYDAQYATVQAVTARLSEIAPILNVEITYSEINSPEDTLTQIAEYRESGEIPFDAIFIFPDLTVQAEPSWSAIRDFAAENNLPILANTPAQVNDGALFSYLADNADVGRQAARQAILILGGTDVKDLPIETAELTLMINLKAANAMGLEVSNDILNQADDIIREETE